jgi:hypothetical protein
MKHHSETSLDNQYILKKMKDRKGKQFLSMGRYQWKG